MQRGGGINRKGEFRASARKATFEVADGHLPGSGDEPPMTACGGNLIGGEIIRNEQCPLCGLATIEDAELGAEQAPKYLRF